MQKKNYLPRLIDTTVTDYLSAFGAVVIKGPKWCGKTWTSAQHCNSEFFLGCVVNRFVLYYANVKKGCRENGECIRTT